MEMKQNSAIKQLMREFNTQMSLKERELTTGVKEAIGEAEKIHHDAVMLNTQNHHSSLV